MCLRPRSDTHRQTRELVRRRQTGESCADDEHPLRSALSFQVSSSDVNERDGTGESAAAAAAIRLKKSRRLMFQIRITADKPVRLLGQSTTDLQPLRRA